MSMYPPGILILFENLKHDGCADFLKLFQYLNILMTFGQILSKRSATFLFSTRLKINEQKFHMVILIITEISVYRQKDHRCDNFYESKAEYCHKFRRLLITTNFVYKQKLLTMNFKVFLPSLTV